ncbi:MAG: hypothetical protein K0Q71_2431 [Thermomicrobiales bacterium]|nr:hypothetical protein [Thermomicrobiales bacterium]
MSRSPILVALVALVVLSGGILPSWSVGAQEATPTPMTGHPLVGAWILDRDLTHPTNPQQLVVATSDGLYLGVDYGGRISVGVWEATGPRTADITLHVTADEQGVVEVREDGLSFTAPYTLEVTGQDGRTEEYAGTTAQGTRITAEDIEAHTGG